MHNVPDIMFALCFHEVAFQKNLSKKLLLHKVSAIAFAACFREVLFRTGLNKECVQKVCDIMFTACFDKVSLHKGFNKEFIKNARYRAEGRQSGIHRQVLDVMFAA